MIEEWKCIPEYEGVYQASSLGNIRSLNYNKTKKIQVLKKSITNSGYFSTSLQTNKKPKKFLLHQLVAMAFLGHKPNGLKKVVNHINFNKLDNRIQNLEIITFRENSNLKHIPSSSRFTGVAWNKLAKKWQSRIRINGKVKHIGYFNTELQAFESQKANNNNL